MLKNRTKPNPLKRALLTTPPELTRMVSVWGQIGSGKSLGKRSLIEKYHDSQGYKVIIMWGGDRNEHLYWTLPSQKKSYWEKVKTLLNLDQEGQKQYKVRLLYPMSKNTIRHKLPQYKNDNGEIIVDSEIFTIPIMSVEVDDIVLATGQGSPATFNTTQSIWRECLDSMKKKDNGADLLKYVAEQDGLKQTIYRNFIKPLVDHRLLQSYNCESNLNLVEEFKDRETISVFCFDLIEKEFRLFIMGWIMRQLNKLVDDGKIPAKNIVSIEECAEFFRATDDSVTSETYKIFRSRLTHYVRMGRRGVHLFMDAQSPNETRGMVEGQSDIVIIGKIVGERDKEALLRTYMQTGQIVSEQFKDISSLRPGEYYIIQGDSPARKRYFFLPRGAFWEKGDGNFYDHVWTKYRNTWKNIFHIIEDLDQQYNSRQKEILEQQKIDEAIRKKKEEEDNLIRLEAERIQMEKKAEIQEEARLIGKKKARDKVNPGYSSAGGTRDADSSSPQKVIIQEPMEDIDLDL